MKQAIAYRAECLRRSRNFDSFFAILNIIRARIERDLKDFIAVDFGGLLNHDQTLAVKLPSHRRPFKLPPRTSHQFAHIRHRAVAVVGQHLDDGWHLVRQIHFVDFLFKGSRIRTLPSRAGDSTLDVVFGHVALFSLFDGQTQADIGIRAAATFSCCRHNFACQPCKHRPTLGVCCALGPLNRCPFAMT